MLPAVLFNTLVKQHMFADALQHQCNLWSQKRVQAQRIAQAHAVHQARALTGQQEAAAPQQHTHTGTLTPAMLHQAL